MKFYSLLLCALCASALYLRADPSSTTAPLPATSTGTFPNETVGYATVSGSAAHSGAANNLAAPATTSTYSGMSVGYAASSGSAALSGTGNNLFGSIADTAHLAGMANDWHCTFIPSGASGSLVATGGTWNIINASGTATITGGTTSYTVSGSTTTIGGAMLSGSIFTVTSPGATILSASNYSRTSYSYAGANVVIQAGVNGPTLAVGSGTTPGLWCSGTDDYATFQALLNTATNSITGVMVYIDSDFTCSNTPIVRGNTRLIGIGGHMWHIAPGANEPGIGSVLTGATISSSNIITQNLWVDCNEPEQSNPRLENSGFLQGSGFYNWVWGSWFGSAEYCDLDLTIVNACNFCFIYSNLYDSRIRVRSIWTDQEQPSQMGVNNDFNHDGPHGWGPDNNLIFHDCDLMGDDNQMPFCPVENTPETGALSQTGTYTYDSRRGHGGPMTNITFDHTFLRNASNGLRLGGQAVANGTNAWENVIDNIQILNTTGTTWFPGAVCTTGGYLGSVQVDNWAVASGTNNGANCLVFSDLQTNAGQNTATAPATYVSVSNIRSDAPVYVYSDSGYNDPGTNDLGGSYFAEVRGLRDRCVAAYTFNTDTSGSTAYDWSSNGAILANSNGVTYTSGTAWGNAATFTGSNYLTLTGTACPNLATLPEWTVCFWFNQNSNSSNFPGVFALTDGTARQFWLGTNGAASTFYGFGDKTSDQLVQWGPGENTSVKFGNGHWIFVCLRKRANDGKQCMYVGGPDCLNNDGWGNYLGAMTGASPSIYFGYNPANSGYFNGQMDNIEIYNRCLTDREMRLMWNAGTDGVPNLTGPGGPSGWFWGGRQWPFNY